MNDDKILHGLDDVPAISQDKCYWCGAKLPENPWFAFIRSNGQMYQVPLCDKCEKDNDPTGAKVEE